MLAAGCHRGGKDVALKKEGTAWPSLTEPPPPVQNSALRDAAVVVAIEDYQSVDDIPGARANAADWVKFLTKTQGVPETNTHLLWNHEATREEMLADARRAAEKVSPGGRLWFIFIGHGAPKKTGDDAWLVGADVRPTPDSIEARGVAQSELLAILEGKEGVQPIVVLDACFNGKTSTGGSVMEAGLQDLVFVSLKTGSRSIVLSASKSDEYAGSLPGLNRPAFSYLLLGAMRGWGDTNKDGTITVQEAVGYSKDALEMLLQGRHQTPEIVGGVGADQSLAISAGEPGPDLTEMRMRGAAANDLKMNADTLAVPDAALFEGGSVNFNQKSDMQAEKLYGQALELQKDETALPETRASTWCALARLSQSTNPYRVQALKMCREWQVYARALRNKETSMVNDYEYLRDYLTLAHKNKDQKQAACAAFLSGYNDLAEADYPHIKHVRRALKALQRGQKAKVPSLSDVKIVPTGSPSANPTPTP
ncbi:MAG: caspase family protein [Deltaproteobacteria bacterium]|nr:caspase family protein [Deltaproteobacteria bacterium]